jgi:hypothetical protein
VQAPVVAPPSQEAIDQINSIPRDQYTSMEESSRQTLTDYIQEWRQTGQTRAANMAAEAQATVDENFVQIMNDGVNNRPQLHIGGEDGATIELNNEAQRTAAQHIKGVFTSEPGTQRHKGHTAAIKSIVRPVASEFQRHVRQQVQQSGPLVPAGAFARQVHDAVMADPASAGMYFTELANQLLEGRSTQADIDYKGALSRQARATAAAQEIDTAAQAELSNEERAALYREQLRGLRLANDMAELKLGFAPQELSADIMQSLSATGLNEIQAQAVADAIGLEWARLNLMSYLGELEAIGAAGSAGATQLDQIKVILDAIGTLADPDSGIELDQQLLLGLVKPVTEGLAGMTFDIVDQATLLQAIFEARQEHWKIGNVRPFGGEATAPSPNETPSPETNSLVDDYTK